MLEPQSNNSLCGRDVLRLLDLSTQEVELVLDTASKQKADWAAGLRERPYEGMAVAVILEKPSLRTRISFEVGISRLGAQPLVMSDSNSAFSRGETVHDTIKVLERFADAIVIRTFAQSKVEEVAHWAQVPVVNALTDSYHPCQVLADLLTIREHLGQIKGLSLAYVGDGNNMANTYLEGGALMGMDVRIATPVSYEPDQANLEQCLKVAANTGAKISLMHDPIEAVRGANIVVTDTCTSMGSEDEHDKRLVDFAGFMVDAELMSKADSNAIFMHCLPAHRGEEVSDEVMDGPWSVIFDEAENRLHAQKALLSLILAK